MFVASASAAAALPLPLVATLAGYSEAVLVVTVNAQPQDEPVIALRDGSGNVWIAAEDLERWRLRLPEANPIAVHGTRYFPLAAYAGLVARLNEQAQTLEVSAPAALFPATRIDAGTGPSPVPDRGALGGFINYALLATHDASGDVGTASIELGAFNSFGAINSTGVGVVTEGQQKYTRLDTTWTYPMPERLTTVRAGDIVSRPGAWGRSLRYGGAQYGTDFTLQPNLVLLPGQAIAGAAAVPSTVDVFVNNALVAQQQVRPGPFSIGNVPPITGTGNLTLVVRDELGREQVISRPFYASASLLRAGLSDFTYDAGWLRENYGTTSGDYGAWFASATYRRGVTDRWTAEARAEAQSGTANAGIASDVQIGTYGTLSGSVAAGHNPEGSGARISLGFDHQSRELSFNVQGTWASSRFRLVGEEDFEFRVEREWLASVTYPIGRYGNLSAAYIDRRYRDQPSLAIASLGYNVSLERWGYVSVALSRTWAEDRSTQITASWTVPFGPASSASVGVDRVRGSATSRSYDERYASIQRNLPQGEGFGYRARLSDNGPRSAGVEYQGRYGSYAAEVSQLEGETAERVFVSGGIGMIGGHAFASRTINDSFGLVRVPGYAGVRVFAQNQEVGRTDDNGELIVPRLLPYLRNPLRIEQSDLPIDVEIETLARDAVPYFRSGVVLEFPVRAARSAVVIVVQETGAPVPAGALAMVEGQATPFPVALDGEAYLTGLELANRVTVKWLDRQCAFEFELPRAGDPQPRLGPFTCRALH